MGYNTIKIFSVEKVKLRDDFSLHRKMLYGKCLKIEILFMPNIGAHIVIKKPIKRELLSHF